MANILQMTLLRYPEIRGGVDTMVVSLVSHLRRRHKVSVFIPGDWAHDELVRRDVDGIPVYTLRLRLPFDSDRPLRGFIGWLAEFPRTLWKLRSLLRIEGINLIHAHVGKDYQMYLRILHWLGGPPYVITLHRGDIIEFPSLPRTSQVMMRFALRGAAHINCVAPWLAKEAEKVFPEIAAVSSVHNGIDLPDSVSLSEDLETQFKPPLPARYAIMIGSFDPYKGHETALRAWGLVSKSAPDLHLLLVGDGALRPRYKAILTELDCERSVHMVGQVPRTDVLRLMNHAIAMVLPSRTEGFAYVLLEAGAVGMPVICTRIAAFTEIIQDGINGIVVPLDDIDALAEAILLVAQDPGLGKRLGDSLKQLIASKYTAEGMTRNYEAIYQSALY